MSHFQNTQNHGRVLQRLFVQINGAPPSAQLDWIDLVTGTCLGATGEKACSNASKTAEALKKPPKSTYSASSASSCGVTVTALLLLLAYVLM